MKKALLLILIISLSLGCNRFGTKVAENKRDSIVYKEKIVTKFVNIYTPKDNSTFRAFINCDSLRNATLSKIDTIKGGQKIKGSILIKNNTITFDCSKEVDSLTVSVNTLQSSLESYQKTEKTNIRAIEQLNAKYMYAKYIIGVLVSILMLIIFFKKRL